MQSVTVTGWCTFCVPVRRVRRGGLTVAVGRFVAATSPSYTSDSLDPHTHPLTQPTKVLSLTRPPSVHAPPVLYKHWVDFGAVVLQSTATMGYSASATPLLALLVVGLANAADGGVTVAAHDAFASAKELRWLHIPKTGTSFKNALFRVVAPSLPESTVLSFMVSTTRARAPRGARFLEPHAYTHRHMTNLTISSNPTPSST